MKTKINDECAEVLSKYFGLSTGLAKSCMITIFMFCNRVRLK